MNVTQSLDIGRALTFMFEEEDWITKFLIASALVILGFFLIIPFLALQGYMLEIIRRVARGEKPALPQWDNWGKYFVEGIMTAIAGFVYALPSVFMTLCAVVPLIALSGDGSSSSDEASGAIFLVTCCLMVAILVVQIPLFLVYYAGIARYAETGQFGSFFQFGALWSFIRQNIGNYGLTMLLLIIVSVVGSFVPVLGTVWTTFASGHLLGQLLDQMKRGQLGTAGFETPITGPR